MALPNSSYLLRVQYLGFRYSGWQTQPGQKTIEEMLVKTIQFVLPGRIFKILGAGRTDAKVSALDGAFELFLEGEGLADKNNFLYKINFNLPSDIKLISINKCNNNFNVIKNTKQKEYVYLFSFGVKNHPYAAPFMANVQEQLNIDVMKQAATMYVGQHDFSSYTVKERKNNDNVRTINSCFIAENGVLRANFFPDSSYALHIEADGFVRYQVRMIIGALIQLGRGVIELAVIEESLKPGNKVEFSYIAPGSGLLLNKLYFTDTK